VSSIEYHQFLVAHSMYAEVTLILISFPCIQTSIEQMQRYWSAWIHKIQISAWRPFRQIVVWFPRSCSKSLWRMSRFFQKGQSSGITSNGVFYHIKLLSPFFMPIFCANFLCQPAHGL